MFSRDREYQTQKIKDTIVEMCCLIWDTHSVNALRTAGFASNVELRRMMNMDYIINDA